MPLILPRGFVRKVCVLGGLLTVLACKHVSSDPPAKPGPPIAAEPEVDLENMDTECAGMVAAFGQQLGGGNARMGLVRRQPHQVAVAGQCRIDLAIVALKARLHAQ